MRKAVVWCLAWCLALALVGCAAAPPAGQVREQSMPQEADAETGGSAAAGREAEETGAVAAAEAAPAEQGPAKRRMLLPVAESRYRGDGSLEERIVFVYDSVGRLQAEQHFDAHDELVGAVSYTYENGRLLRKETLDAAGALRSYHAYEHAAGGLLSVDTLHNDQHQPQTSSRYLYDEEGRRTRWEIRDGSGRLMVYTTYLYQGAEVSGIEIHGSDGELTDWSRISYDEKGRKTGESYYETPKKLVKTVEYAYADGLLESESVFNADGRLLGRYLYQYDENGERVSTMFLDDRENITEIVEKTYDLVEVE